MAVSQRCEESAHSLCAMATCTCVCHKPEAGPDSAADTVEDLSKLVNFLSSRVLELQERVKRHARLCELRQQALKPPRIRTNRSTTSKGVPSYDLTLESEGLSTYPVEALDADIAEHLRRFDELIAEMGYRTVMLETQ